VIDLAELDSAFGFPLCSLRTWDMLRGDAPQDLMTALQEAQLDPSRTGWLVDELCRLMTESQTFTVDLFSELFTINCGLFPFREDQAKALAESACAELLKRPQCLVDLVLEIKPWALAISSLKRASNWPALRTRTLELARNEWSTSQMPGELFVALAPPSAAWVADMVKLDIKLLASAKVKGQIRFIRLLLTCARHADESQQLEARRYLDSFIAALRQRGRLQALLDDPELAPLTEMAVSILGGVAWMNPPSEASTIGVPDADGIIGTGYSYDSDLETPRYYSVTGSDEPSDPETST
jgi:hypothetical protein